MPGNFPAKRFTNMKISRARPRTFLVLPFTDELDLVYRVINDTVESWGIDCIRPTSRRSETGEGGRKETVRRNRRDHR
jgi:hypothetical protein